MGNPDGDRSFSQGLYWSILRKQLTLSGTWNSSYKHSGNDWSDAIEAISSGRLRTTPVISHILDREKLLTGMELMRDKKEPYCKVMVRFWEERRQP